MKVRSDRYGIIHYIAFCSKCDWQACVFTDETPTTKSVIRATRKHVKQTGHNVTIEGGTSTKYFLEHNDGSDFRCK